MRCIQYCRVYQIYDDNKQVIKINKFNEATCDFSGDLVEIDTSADNDTLAEQIYKVTGIYSPFSMDGFVEEGGFNPLFCVAYVLQQFGFDVELLIKAPLDLEHLANEYPIEAQVLKKLNCPITYFEDSAEAQNNVLIPIIVYPLGEGMTSHYLVTYEQQWLDTELDEHPLSWDSIQNWETSQNKRPSATWTGFALHVSRKV